MKINIYILLIILLSALSLNAQLSTYEKPPSYSMKSELLKYDDKNIKVMPPIDLAKLLEEDKEEEAHGLPPRFGFKHKVSLNTENSGQWYKLDDGRRMWRLKISCPGAKSINLLYDKFWLPEGGKFFIYSADKRQCIGAFTTINNKGDRKEPRGFATELVIGDESVLEYYTPKEQTEEAIISIDYVVQGYKKLGLLSKYDDNDEEKLQDLGYEMSFPNHVNVNCSPEGDYWQMEKRAVAMIVVSGNRLCSGSLINNTAQDKKPYFLSANHCMHEGNTIYDAINNPDLSNFSFYWNYETPGCGNTGDPAYYTTSGATLVANDTGLIDFALLKLIEDPKYIPNFAPYYLGWERGGGIPEYGIGIHHPWGDVKKISTFYNRKIINYVTTFKVWWSETQNGFGVTQGGSSGSPFLNTRHRISGYLRNGSEPSITNPSERYSEYVYFGFAWFNYPNADYRRRLNYWLDPSNSGRLTLDGLSNCREKIVNYNINSNTTIGCDQVKFQNSTVNNNAKVMIHTKKLIIQDNFRLESGNRFEVNLSPQ